MNSIQNQLKVLAAQLLLPFALHNILLLLLLLLLLLPRLLESSVGSWNST